MIIDFLIRYCDLIILFIIGIINMFILIFKKKVKIDDIFTTVLTVLPNYIKEAEAKYSVGAEKFSYVFNRCVDLLILLTGDTKEAIIEKYTHKIHISIENILSTPEKKVR